MLKKRKGEGAASAATNRSAGSRVRMQNFRMIDQEGSALNLHGISCNVGNRKCTSFCEGKNKENRFEEIGQIVKIKNVSVIFDLCFLLQGPECTVSHSNVQLILILKSEGKPKGVSALHIGHTM